MISYRAIILALLVLAPSLAAPGFAADVPSSPEAAAGLAAQLAGTWVGSRLQCRKDPSGPVRCGTPTASRITFRPDGTGTSVGEGLPAQFLYQAADADKFVVRTVDKSRSWEFFEVKFEGEFIQFQTYVHTEEGSGEGENYIHFIYDLGRETE